jgi:hypothetical protein
MGLKVAMRARHKTHKTPRNLPGAPDQGQWRREGACMSRSPHAPALAVTALLCEKISGSEAAQRVRSETPPAGRALLLQPLQIDEQYPTEVQDHQHYQCP